MSGNTKKMNLVILISGGGGLMRTAIKNSLESNSLYQVKAVVASSNCPGVTIAENYGVPVHVVDFSDKQAWNSSSMRLWSLLEDIGDVDYVVIVTGKQIGRAHV